MSRCRRVLPSPARSVLALSLFLLQASVGCGGDSAPGPPEAVRDTLPGGAERIRYGPLPVADPVTVDEDLRIGVLEGDPSYVLGDVRGIEVGEDGSIFVLDYQAAEIRAFDPDGSFRHLVARRGEGPGEILEANGMVRAHDGTLWVQDHRQWQLLRLEPEGREVERVPMFVRQYGYLWDGTIDRSGRIWTSVSHLEGPWPGPPEPGLNETVSNLYLKAHHPETGQADSIFVGTRTERGWAVTLEGGWGFRPIPWEAGLRVSPGPTGEVWVAGTEAYRIARLDERGDTLLVIEAEVTPEPVTQVDRERFLEQARARGPGEERIARDILRVSRAAKPVLAGLVVDDRGNLWVRRFQDADDSPLFDVFHGSGDYLGSFRLGFRTPVHFSPRIRGGKLYTLGVDELDVPSVVRVEVPLPDR